MESKEVMRTDQAILDLEAKFKAIALRTGRISGNLVAGADADPPSSGDRGSPAALGEDHEDVLFYDKRSSFFDKISYEPERGQNRRRGPRNYRNSGRSPSPGTQGPGPSPVQRSAQSGWRGQAQSDANPRNAWVQNMNTGGQADPVLRKTGQNGSGYNYPRRGPQGSERAYGYQVAYGNQGAYGPLPPEDGAYGNRQQRFGRNTYDGGYEAGFSEPRRGLGNFRERGWNMRRFDY